MDLALGRSAAIAPPFFHRAGPLSVRLAVSAADIAAAQALRYRIFYGEMGAKPTPAMGLTGHDVDEYDAVCDHLLVVDHSAGIRPQVVGTYRLLRQDVASAHRGFYSAGEYDLSRLVAHAGPDRLLELGRSCVAPGWRNTPPSRCSGAGSLPISRPTILRIYSVARRSMVPTRSSTPPNCHTCFITISRRRSFV